MKVFVKYINNAISRKIIVDFNETKNNENINCDLTFCETCKIAKDIEQFRSICNKNKKFNKLCRRCLSIVVKYRINYALKGNF